MTDLMNSVVPLPDHLSECGCRFAPSHHSTSCAAAIAFDATPLHERPEYREGQRFAAITWDFPLRMTMEVNVEVELDPVAIILDRADEYAAFTLERGYEDWEKPLVFLSSLIEEQCDFGVWFGSRRQARDESHIEHSSEYPRWTLEDTERVNEALARRPDPNQGVLDV